tara:strand:- start:246 stop:452 length:207 start_codon:yes stop_codon:yes gene_type:complete
MKWLKDDPPKPRNGDTRSRLVFAWNATQVGKYMVWMENFEVHERYFQGACGNPGWWSETSRNTLEVAE